MKEYEIKSGCVIDEERLIINRSDILIRLGLCETEYLVITSIDPNYSYTGEVYTDIWKAIKRRKELLNKMDTMIH